MTNLLTWLKKLKVCNKTSIIVIKTAKVCQSSNTVVNTGCIFGDVNNGVHKHGGQK